MMIHDDVDDELMLNVRGSSTGQEDKHSDDALMVDDHIQNDAVVLHVDDDEKSETSVHAKMSIGSNMCDFSTRQWGDNQQLFGQHRQDCDRGHKAD